MKTEGMNCSSQTLALKNQLLVVIFKINQNVNLTTKLQTTTKCFSFQLEYKQKLTPGLFLIIGIFFFGRSQKTLSIEDSYRTLSTKNPSDSIKILDHRHEKY